MRDRLYKLRDLPIVHETVDHEVVIINFENGNYYSLVGVGATIWGLLEVGISWEGLMQSLLLKYEVEREVLGVDLEVFLRSLTNEGLVSSVESIGHDERRPSDSVNKGEYDAPVLEVHEDMKEVIMLDPVHEMPYAKMLEK